MKTNNEDKKLLDSDITGPEYKYIAKKAGFTFVELGEHMNVSKQRAYYLSTQERIPDRWRVLLIELCGRDVYLKHLSFLRAYKESKTA